MQDSSRFGDPRISQHKLDDLVEYHRFLKRFKASEEERRLKDVLFDGRRFRSLPGEDGDL